MYAFFTAIHQSVKGQASLMESRKILLGFVLLSVIQVTWARFVVEKNNLRVTSPEEIKGTYNSAIANFGIPQYGGSLGGTVFYFKNNGQLCKELTDTNFVRHTRGGRPIFFLVDRGDCLFALKVWNAQKAGASAVLVADDVYEHLITMDTPLEKSPSAEYEANITIPSTLIEKKVGEKLKKSISERKLIHVILDWREAVPHPDNRVEYELWTSSNDQCGLKCTMITNFVKHFKGVAQILERGGYTQFTPHYLTWYCPEAFRLSKQCQSQCINHGRYCAPDPEQNFHSGYDGKDVVLENLRQLCLFRVANESQKPWLWWDYVTDFQLRCPMKNKMYNKECADAVIKSLGLDIKKIEACMGDPNADANNPVLEQEERAQVGKGSRGDVTILPTLIVNNRQYRGKFVRSALLKAICAGFQESTEPAVCLTHEVETNECLVNNGGCWQDKAANITACRDTFRGRICQCPLVDGVQFKGDGYRQCVASGPGRCKINNGGCWHETQGGQSFSACLDDEGGKCQCPPGFKGDGIKNCEDIDECKETRLCQCPECSCKDTWGGYECSCSRDLLYIREHDTCISKNAVEFWSALMVARVAFIGLAIAVVGAYIVYKYRLRSYMNSEIRAIMAQYMPLDGHEEVPNSISQSRG